MSAGRTIYARWSLVEALETLCEEKFGNALESGENNDMPFVRCLEERNYEREIIEMIDTLLGEIKHIELGL